MSLLYREFKYIVNHGTGYRVTADDAQHSFQEVKAEWKVPELSGDGLLDLWVGLVDPDADLLVQTGVELTYTDGEQVNRAWWEIYPADEPTYFPHQNPPIAAGDTITAKVSYDKDGDLWQFNVGVRPESGTPRLFDAEGRRGAPSTCTQADVMMETKISESGTPIAKFGDIEIKHATVREKSGKVRHIATLQPQPLLMVNGESCLLVELEAFVDKEEAGYPFSLRWLRSR